MDVASYQPEITHRLHSSETTRPKPKRLIVKFEAERAVPESDSGPHASPMWDN